MIRLWPKKYCDMPTTIAPAAITQNQNNSALQASQLRASSALKNRAFQWVTATATPT